MLDEKEQKIYELHKAEKAMIEYDKDTLKKVQDEKDKEKADKEKKNSGESGKGKK
jgi:hypothetical protein